MSTPVVSIIMPAFNADRFIAETIRSVRTQTFDAWELLVVDDGSTDGTAQVVETFSKDLRIRLLRQKNAGVAAARNSALKNARGEWVAFLDADDVWCPEKLAEQVKAVERQPQANLVFTNYYLWDGERDLELRFKSGKFPACDFERRLIFYNLFGMSSVLLRRDALERVGEFDQQVAPAEDWDLWLRLADDGLRAAGVDKPLLRYRLWSGNASKNSIRMMQANIRVLQKGLQRCRKNAGTGREHDYARALEIACGNLELAKASANIANAPARVPGDIGRAWKHCPTRLKWLCWYAGAVWPGFLGGELFRRRIYKKIQSKW